MTYVNSFEIEYRHGIDISEPKQPLTTTQINLLIAFASLLSGGCLFAMFKYGSHHMIWFVPALIVWFMIKGVITYQYTPPESLLLEPRFLVCAKTVIYYSLINKISIKDGIIELYCDNKQVLKIERTRFKSVSTKAAKIKINQQRRFDKVVEELLPRVQINNPGVLIER